MSDNNQPLDLASNEENPKDIKEQTVLEQMFQIPPFAEFNQRIAAIEEAITDTEKQLDNVAQEKPKEKALFGRRLQKLKRMLQSTINQGQVPDDQVTIAANINDLKPVPAKVSVDDDADEISIPEAPSPNAWQQQEQNSNKTTKIIEQDQAAVDNNEQTATIIAENTADAQEQDQKQQNTQNEEQQAEALEEEISQSATPTDPAPILAPSNDQAADTNAEPPAEATEEVQDWSGNEATLQMDAPKFDSPETQIEEKDNGDDDWAGDATLQMDAPKFDDQANADWDGNEATMQMDAPQLHQDGEWSGNEATLQMNAPNYNQAKADAEDWSGNEATMQMNAPDLSSNQEQGDWTGTEITMQMNVNANAQTNDADWDGNEATMQMAAGNNADWDGNEATLQNMPTDSADWDGSEATLQSIPAANSGDTSSTKSGSGTRSGTQATFIPRKDDGTPTGQTLVTGDSKPKTRGAGSTRGLDAGWHLHGRKGPATGDVWGDYEIGGVLGEGGMGLVYRARQISLNRKCAVKVLAPHLAADDKVRERFELEAQTTSLLISPNIVNVFAAGVNGENNYFVMEYVEGEDLSDKIKERTREGRVFSTEEATDIVVQAARGLAEAARHHIVHRDIKPGNLMITKKNEVKIADFGIVKVMGESSLTMTGQAVGTPSYLSPEQGRGDEVDQRSDLYSLGVVFYQLITGQRPFDGSTPNALIYQHNFEEPKMPKEIIPSISDEIQAVVIKLLSKKQEKRYQRAEELIRDLEQLQEGKRLEALLAEKLSTGADEARKENLSWAQRHLLHIVAAVAVILMSVGGYAWYQIDQANTLRIETGKKRDAISSKRERLKSILSDTVEIPEDIPNELASFVTLVTDNPDLEEQEDRENINNWNRKIATTNVLKKELSFLDELKTDEHIPLDTRSKAKEQLLELRSKIGSSSEDVIRWDNIILSTEAFISANKSSLSELDRTQTDKLTTADRVQFERVINDMRPLIENEEIKDSDLQRWSLALLAFDKLVAANKETLGILDDNEIIITENKRLSLINPLNTLTAMIGAQDENIIRWSARLNSAGKEVTDLRKDLSRLSFQNTHKITTVEAADLEKKLARIIALKGIPNNIQERYRKRLDDEATFRNELRERLKAVDKQENFDHLNNEIVLFAQLVGIEDPDVIRWQQKTQDVKDLRTKLQHLNVSVPLQDDTITSLDALIALIGEEDRQVAIWKQKVDRVNKYLSDLATLDEIRIIPTNADVVLNALIKDISNTDKRVQRWANKITRVEELKSSLAGLEKETSMSIAVLEKRHQEFKELVNNIGMNDEDLKPWAERLAVIDGPGKPNWAHTYGRDNSGVWAEIHLPKFIPEEERDKSLATFEIAENQLPNQYNASDLQDNKNNEHIVKMRFRFVPSGDFMMGATNNDAWQEPDENKIQSTLTKSYWIADSECSQAFYKAIMKGRNPSKFVGDFNPVERVSWRDCLSFITQIKKQIPDFPVRLPTESEWERACKAGFNETIYGGQFGPTDESDIDNIAWHKDNANKTSHNIGVRQPNLLGLHDMHGNVWEWCQDGYNNYPTKDAVDFVGVGELRVARGGSWGDSLEKLRATNRLGLKSNMRSSYLGFRLAADVEWPQNHEPDGNIILAKANQVLEQFKIDQQLTANIRLYFQLEWPKVSANEDTGEQQTLLLVDSVGFDPQNPNNEDTKNHANDPNSLNHAVSELQDITIEEIIFLLSQDRQLEDTQVNELLQILEQEAERFDLGDVNVLELLELIDDE